ncbi:hypothetical protein AVEN_268247-2-1, partial [Araneus ventricosus]
SCYQAPSNTLPPKLKAKMHRKPRYAGDTKFSRWSAAEVWRKACQLKCRPRHLIAFPNDEVRPKISLVLLQNGILMQLNQTGDVKRHHRPKRVNKL